MIWPLRMLSTSMSSERWEGDGGWRVCLIVGSEPKPVFADVALHPALGDLGERSGSRALAARSALSALP